LEVVECRGRIDDDFETAPRLEHPLELLVAAQCRRQRGEQLVGGELGLRLVVVDIIVDDDTPLRRLAGLAGAQNDAYGFVLERVANIMNEIETGAVGLHNDVEQYRSDVRMPGQ